jgi:hypothetical protein
LSEAQIALLVLACTVGGLLVGAAAVTFNAPRPAPSRPSDRDDLQSAHLSEIAFLRQQLREERASHELREAEIRAQLVALANSNALAMASYYGPARPTEAGAAGVRRLVPPGGPRPPDPDDGADTSLRPWQNGLFGDDHVDLGPDFRVDVPSTTAPAETDAEEALEEATIEAAARERERARLEGARQEA